MTDLEELKAALRVARSFHAACRSAWSCGEPQHRVKTMLDRFDEFSAVLNKPEIENLLG